MQRIASVVVLETMVSVSRPNLPVFNCPVLVLTTGLGLAFKQDQDLINFYCAISATKL